MQTALPVSPPEISTILTSLGVFSLAIAAAVGGIYKGIKEVQKGSGEGGTQVKSALLLETATVRGLTESNAGLTTANKELRDHMAAMNRSTERMTEALNDHRALIRSQIEEQHRLRAATIDLIDVLRRPR